MLLPPVHLNFVILFIVVVEIAIFFHQVLSFLARPYEKERVWHAILIGLLIVYNLAENLIIMPDTHIPLPIVTQGILSESAGYFVTMYLPFYCYKTMGLSRLRFHARYGFLFILVPTVFFFFIYYPLSGNLPLTIQYVYILPGIYAVTALYSAARAISLQYKADKDGVAYRERRWIFFAVVFWCASPFIDAFFGQPKWMVGAFNNIIFLLLNGMFMRQTVRRFIAEYRQLQESNIRLAEKVKERTLQLERANEQRTNAFVNLIHETKTPLTLINNYLEEYIGKYGHKEELGMLKSNLDKLNRDISNLFDLERFNKGFVVYDHRQVADFSRILQDNLVLFRNYCRKKDITLYETIGEGVLVKADPGAINGIVNNLVENAIRYTGRGGEVRILLEASEDKICFAVTDNGIGISRTLHDKIFEPYYQINSQKGGRQGMGLGLPIVKKAVTGLHGEITVESDPEKAPGTKITILLNRYVAGRDDMSIANYTVSNYSGLEDGSLDIPEPVYDEKKQTVLLVEDNQAMAGYLARKLSVKYNVAVALNGSEALAKIKSYPVLPDLIISDVMMDRLDGFKLADIVAEDPDCMHIPFIFLSAKFTAKDRARGLKSGAIDFIQKPFSTEEVLLKVGSVLENAARQKRALFASALRVMKTAGNLDFSQKEDAPANRFEQNCRIYQLTARETAISKLIREGYSYKQIGDSLFIAERTVTKHAQNIFEKVRVSNKIELINKLGA